MKGLFREELWRARPSLQVRLPVVMERSRLHGTHVLRRISRMPTAYQTAVSMYLSCPAVGCP